MSDFDTREISDIKIEDPLNFLTAAEKEAYIRAQDAERMKAKREELSRTQELQRLEEERIETERRRAQEMKRAQEAKRSKKDVERRKRQAARRRREEMERRRKEEKTEQLIRTATIATGVLILLLLLVIAGSFVKNYFDARAEENQIAADADGSVVPEEEEGDEAPESVEVEGFTAMNDTVTTTTDLRLRSTPDSDVDNNIVATATRGTQLKRTGINDAIGWSRVEYDGKTLYCATRYLQ
ncbi:MAG: hypothetical protein IJR58_08540 [Lachnospiraceae bacterium]|nr:hypothetical protein [Lachnospiraceae bacterium]